MISTSYKLTVRAKQNNIVKNKYKRGIDFYFPERVRSGYILLILFYLYKWRDSTTNKDFSGEKCIFNLGLITKKRLKFIEKIYFKLLERGGEMIKKM